MYTTQGINHLGLSVKDLNETVSFFVDCLGWEESGRDESYPRSSVSDGKCRLTLWQVDQKLAVNEFHRRQNIGLHHVAFEVSAENDLNDLAAKIKAYPKVIIEFMPELVAKGPRKHMMFQEPGGIRLELIWPGS